MIDEYLASTMSPSNPGIKPRAWSLICFVDDDRSISIQGALENGKVKPAARALVAKLPSIAEERFDELFWHFSLVISHQSVGGRIIDHEPDVAATLHVYPSRDWRVHKNMNQRLFLRCSKKYMGI